MESPKRIPSLNLEDVASDRQDNGNEAENRSNKDGKNEMETRTYGAEAERIESEIEISKSSFELLDAAKGSLTTSSSSFSRAFRDSKKDRRLKRHHPDRTDNLESNAFETNESSPLPDSIRSSAREIIVPANADKHLPISPGRSDEEPESCLESAARETIVAENKQLKEVLSRERRQHVREKNRIRQVLFAIDEALSSLPSRLGKIRIQNQKNLMRMNTLPVEFRDRGDFEMIVRNRPKRLENSVDKRSVQLSEDACSDVSRSPGVLFEKLESLNNLIEGMKKGRSAPIEAVLDNELCAISLLKNEIKYTKRKIEQRSKTDSDSAIVNWQKELGVSHPIKWNPDSDDVRNLEKYIWLQKEAISALSVQVQKAKESCIKEMKEKERIQTEKKVLMSEIMKLKNREESQRSKARSSDAASAARPFRIIKELKAQLEEKEKILANCKAKISRLEAAASNKGTLLENERKKNEELEAKLKILAAENKSFTMQINSLQYINKELKDQMDVLKNQIEILIKQNAEFCTNNPYDLKAHFNEIVDVLKAEDARVRTVQEEAEKKLKEQENQHFKAVDTLRTSFERCEKMNVEYLRTLKGLILSLHNHQLEKTVTRKRRNSYGKVKEILGITELELENLFGGNLKNNSDKELEDLYEKCYSFVKEDEECEFSLKLSAWLFDLVKQKTINQNFNESPSD